MSSRFKKLFQIRKEKEERHLERLLLIRRRMYSSTRFEKKTSKKFCRSLYKCKGVLNKLLFTLRLSEFYLKKMKPPDIFRKETEMKKIRGAIRQRKNINEMIKIIDRIAKRELSLFDRMSNSVNNESDARKRQLLIEERFKYLSEKKRKIKELRQKKFKVYVKGI